MKTTEPKNEITEEIGTKLKAARMAHGVTLRAMAKAIGSSERSMRSYEDGSSDISSSKLYAAAEFLHVSVSDLFPSEKAEV